MSLYGGIPALDAFRGLGRRARTYVRPIEEAAGSARSLRSRWHRAFTLLFLVVVLGAVANFAGTRVLVGAYRSTADWVEEDATLLARLRADIAAHSGLLHTAMDGGAVDQQRLSAAAASVRAAFERGMAESHAAEGRRLLEEASGEWQAAVRAAVPLDPSMPVADQLAQHRLLVQGTDGVSVLLDQAGAASRAAGRAVHARAARVEQAGMAAKTVLVVLMTALMVHLARRLSAEVIQPVALLRASANRLAAGELHHRVDLGRTDELGDLAASFNAMADAIDGSQRTLATQATHDSLTGLANRAAFQARLEAALAQPDRREGVLAVMFLDLDDFKGVNDTLGHAAGDELLREVAVRLQRAVRPRDLVARLGGDEFALFLDGVADAGVAFRVGERAVAALAEPVAVTGTRVVVGASVGLAVREDDSDPDSLMREADIAMYTAKGRGKNRVERFDASLDHAVAEHHALKADVAGAAGRGELVLDYQPIIDLATGGFAGLEALVRWQHPTRGLLPPSSFIGLAEETGAIVDIGTWVLDTAARQVQSWQRRYGRPDLGLAVNVSVRQLDDPAYAGQVGTLLGDAGLDPGRLIVEVTESVLADPAGGAAESLATLRRLGVRVALDDFGTGYSSIGYLQRLPVDILKIDRSFVSGEHADSSGVLLEAIVALAQRLGLEIIPEGIEAPGQLVRLRDLGCRTGQGFLLSRPVPAAAIEELLAAPAALLPPGLAEPGPAVQRV